MSTLRQRLLQNAIKVRDNAIAVHRDALRRGAGTILRDKEVISVHQLEIDVTFNAVVALRLREGKTIVFPSEQVAVFAGLLKNKLIIPLDYKLPFQSVLLEFTSPVNVIGFDGERQAIGFLLEQREETESGFNAAIERVREADRLFHFEDSVIKHIDWSKGKTVTINEMMVIYDDEGSSNQISWNSHDPDGFDTGEDWDTDKLSSADRFKQLAIACIGYINCENIYLESVGGVPESVNRKREAKGKRRLEPYYVCRIRGVSYDKNDTLGTGSKHGIRYDVRGHFRRLTTGKTIWVRAHQRGITNELYVPKVYKVDRRQQP